MRLLGAAGLGGPAGLAPAFAQERVFRHGSTLIEPLKYPEGFSQLAYVNRDAPKGGRITITSELGSGSVFSISLPVVPPEPTA